MEKLTDHPIIDNYGNCIGDRAPSNFELKDAVNEIIQQVNGIAHHIGKIEREQEYRNEQRRRRVKNTLLTKRSNTIMNILRRIFHRMKPHHHTPVEVFLWDDVWDIMTDSDELDDIHAITKVQYCSICGKILKKEHTNSWESDVSPLYDVASFIDATGINPKHITMWK